MSAFFIFMSRVKNQPPTQNLGKKPPENHLKFFKAPQDCVNSRTFQKLSTQPKIFDKNAQANSRRHFEKKMKILFFLPPGGTRELNQAAVTACFRKKSPLTVCFHSTIIQKMLKYMGQNNIRYILHTSSRWQQLAYNQTVVMNKIMSQRI